MASSRSEENVNLRHFPTQDGVTVLVSPAILLDLYDLILLWQMFKPIFYGTVMLLVDVIAGLTNTVTPSCVGKCLRLTFSSDLEEAMFETGKSLSAISKFDSVLEKNQPIYKFVPLLPNLSFAVIDPYPFLH